MPARYFAPPSPLLPPPPPADAHAELLASLTRINTFNPPVQTCSTGWHHAGLYTGPSSVAFLFYRLSQLYPDMTFKGQHLTDWAAAYLELGQSYLPGYSSSSSSSSKRASVDASHCGVANETLCQLALRACLEHDTSLAHALCAYATGLLAPAVVGGSGPGSGSDEWLYGRAGYLYLLRLVRAAFSSGSPDETSAGTGITTLLNTINRTIELTINRILATASASHPWQWHGAAYLGAVHGAIGIITQVVLSSSPRDDDDDQHHPHPTSHIITASIEPILQAILSLQHPLSGNFPPSFPSSSSSSSSSSSDHLVQFCHGSPGVVACLRTILHSHSHSHSPMLSASLQRDIESAIERAQPDLLARGVLTKDPCLCHGVPTNAFALVSDSQFEGYLALTASALLEANSSWMRKAGQSSDFVGLYTGEAGRAWMWAVVDQMHRHSSSNSSSKTTRWNMGIIGFSDL